MNLGDAPCSHSSGKSFRHHSRSAEHRAPVALPLTAAERYRAISIMESRNKGTSRSATNPANYGLTRGFGGCYPSKSMCSGWCYISSERWKVPDLPKGRIIFDDGDITSRPRRRCRAGNIRATSRPTSGSGHLLEILLRNDSRTRAVGAPHRITPGMGPSLASTIICTRSASNRI